MSSQRIFKAVRVLRRCVSYSSRCETHFNILKCWSEWGDEALHFALGELFGQNRPWERDNKPHRHLALPFSWTWILPCQGMERSKRSSCTWRRWTKFGFVAWCFPIRPMKNVWWGHFGDKELQGWSACRVPHQQIHRHSWHWCLALRDDETRIWTCEC